MHTYIKELLLLTFRFNFLKSLPLMTENEPFFFSFLGSKPRDKQKIKTGFHQHMWKDIVYAQVKTRLIQM